MTDSVEENSSSYKNMTIDASAEPTLTRPIDLSQLEEHLSQLVDAYRSALRAVARLPRFGKLNTTIDEMSASGKSKPPQENRRRVVRAFVQLFVEAHIRARLDVLIEILNIEAISLQSDDPGAKKINAWVEQLREMRELLPAWGRYYRLTKIPLLSALLPLLGAFLLQLIHGAGWRELLSLRSFILLFYLYVIIAPLVSRYGFRCKRAIFCGGVTVPIHLVLSPGNEIERWKELPNIDVYDAENQLFQTLRIAKSREFPLDLVFLVIPYLILVAVVSASVDALQKLHLRSFYDSVGLLGGWLMVAVVFYTPIKYYQQRRSAKKL